MAVQFRNRRNEHAHPYGSTGFRSRVEPLFRILTQDQARQILAYPAEPELQQKIEVLAAKCNEGELTDEERAEYEGYVRANKFVAIMQAKARQLVSG